MYSTRDAVGRQAGRHIDGVKEYTECALDNSSGRFERS